MYIFYWKKKNLGLIAALVMAVMVLSIGIYDFKNIPASTITDHTEPVYQGNTEKKKMAFAVNVDWGESIIPQMLEILEKNNARATFFITGRFAERFPQIIRDISAKGHELANHGYSHPHVNNLTRAQNQEEIIKTEKIIEEITGNKTVLFAPPYGEKEKHVIEAAAEIGYQTTLWTVDTVDWQESNAQAIIDKIVKNAGNGVIVLMHPKEVTLEYLPVLINRLRQRGYEITTVSSVIN